MRTPINSAPSHRSRALAVALAVVLVCNLGTLVYASSTFKHRAADGSVVFSDAPVVDGVVQRKTYSGKPHTRKTNNPCNGLSTAAIFARGERMQALFDTAARKSGISSSLIKAVARAESCFNATAQSHAGAQGLMQLMPGTARELGVTDSFNKDQNVVGGARYLARMMERYDNDLELALAAYNAGPGNVDRYNGVPPFNETRRYIATVRAFHQQYLERQTAQLALSSSSE